VLRTAKPVGSGIVRLAAFFDQADPAKGGLGIKAGGAEGGGVKLLIQDAKTSSSVSISR